MAAVYDKTITLPLPIFITNPLSWIQHEIRSYPPELLAVGLKQIVTAIEPSKVKLAGCQTSRRVARSPDPSSSSVSVPLTDYFNKSDLQWFGTVSVGTPP
ncbi:putative Peptidase A1 domain-containing protein [Seiridium cardinale]